MLLTGLLGWPLGHTRSPAMHNAAFAATHIEGIYLPLAVPPPRLVAAVTGLVALGFRGCNVTIPHKQAVLPLMHELTAAAQAIGAVNTIIVENEHLRGDNTDAPGFWSDLLELGIASEVEQAGRALILGGGGSARAVCYALASHDIPTTVIARRPAQAEELVTSLRPHLTATADIQARSWHDLAEIAPEHTLIVNCTPLGMHPHVETSPWPKDLAFHPQQILYDLVYNPECTQLMQQARAYGARAYHGLGMLVHQGALAWSLWTGQAAPVAAMRNALTSSSAPPH